MKLFVRLLISAVSLLVVAYLVPGFHVEGFWVAAVSAIVIGIVNTLIRPILQFIALPISILTFGISAFLINVLLLWGSSVVIPGFEISSFGSAVAGSIVLSLVSWFLNMLTR